jgi:hypothetical protein
MGPQHCVCVVDVRKITTHIINKILNLTIINENIIFQ